MKSLPLAFVYVALAIIILALAKIFKEFLTPYKVAEELTEKDNPALGLSITGYYLAVFIIFIGVIFHPMATDTDVTTLDFQLVLHDLVLTLFYTTFGIILLNAAYYIVDKALLPKFSTKKEIIEDRNVGTGAVEFGSYISTGLIVAGAINGESTGQWWFGIFTSLVFFVLGQLVLICFAFIYQKVTAYDIHDEIEKDNIAAGVAFGGNMIAISILVLKGIAGTFPGWDEALIRLLVWSIIGFITLMAFRWIIDLLFVPNATISEEISRDKNINAAYLESSILIGISLVLFFVF